jgi:putative MFS transporter
VADRFGRRTSFFFAYFLITAAGIASAFAPSFAALVIFRGIVGFGVAGATVPFDLLAEFLSPEKRGQYLIQIEYYWTVGSLFVAGIAWAILGSLGWRILTLITVLPVLLVSVACAAILPESPRWLISKGRYREAEAIVKNAAEVNGTPIAHPFTFAPCGDGDKSDEGMSCSYQSVIPQYITLGISIS